MRRVRYGAMTIEYSVEERTGLNAHYISVERDSGVVLKGSSVAPEKADQLILKKAGWIMQKLRVVSGDQVGDIVTGSRLPYLGRSYYVELSIDPSVMQVAVFFNYSKFRIVVPNRNTGQEEIIKALDNFYRLRCIEKITPRVVKTAERTGLSYSSLSFRKMNKRWGSCTPANKIILNTDAAKLPWSLIDYLIIHELCHTKVKDHSKAFWRQLDKYEPGWRMLDERMKDMQF